MVTLIVRRSDTQLLTVSQPQSYWQRKLLRQSLSQLSFNQWVLNDSTKTVRKLTASEAFSQPSKPTASPEKINTFHLNHMIIHYSKNANQFQSSWAIWTVNKSVDVSQQLNQLIIHFSKSARQLLIEAISQPLRNTVSLQKAMFGRSQVRILSRTQIFSLSHAHDMLSISFSHLFQSLKFTIFHSFNTHCIIDIADPSSMQDTCQIWT